ncbi:MAG: hypothetical protein HY010_11155 [Acidobacteria bacterium]|nr:hypothetical protein [Acidobacteriota bacterium]
MKTILFGFVLSIGAQVAFGIDNLKLNAKPDYTSDSHDGLLITGDDIGSGFVANKPNYVIIYGEGCFNSKRQAQRTVDLYEKYRGLVHFVVVDLDVRRSPEQEKLVQQYYQGYIPHVVVLDGNARAIYNSSGEVESKKIEILFRQALSARASGMK